MKTKVLIIAEAGVNHNGDITLAKRLIDVAVEAGADIVKFQTFKADKLVSKNAKKASYQAKNLEESDDSQYNMLKKLELTEEFHHVLLDYCRLKGISFLSTGFDEESIDFLDNLGISLFKVPSGEITNKPYLQHIGGKGKPVILSTGMSSLEEVKDAVDTLERAGLNHNDLTVLHCNTEYPTPMSDVNLLAMLTMEKELGVKVGYSDHTLGIEVPVAAVALGAMVIEKHFTVDRNLPGPDHKASLEPDELKFMVQAIRNIELAIAGSGIKEPSDSEMPNRVVARKSIHLAREIEAGEVIRHEHLIMRRPGDGISPMDIQKIVGKKIKQALAADTKLTWELLEK